MTPIDPKQDLTPAGWPRPMIDGVPIPWVSIPRELGKTDEARRHLVLERRLCQVCGLTHNNGGVAYLVVNDSAEPADRNEMAVLAMDDAILHRHCYQLAVGRCPGLIRLREQGELIAYKVPVRALEHFTDDRTGKTRWGAALEHCERVA